MVTCLCAAAPARAATDTFHIEAGLGTVAPLYVGGQVLAKTPGRFMAGVEVGVIPKPYAGFINSVAQSFDAYNDETAEIIKGAVSGGVVFRPSVGFQPSRELNLEVMAGYTLLKLSEDIGDIEIIKQAVRRGSQVAGDERVDLPRPSMAFT